MPQLMSTVYPFPYWKQARWSTIEPSFHLSCKLQYELPRYSMDFPEIPALCLPLVCLVSCDFLGCRRRPRTRGGSRCHQKPLPPPHRSGQAADAPFEKGQAYFKAGKFQAAWVEFEIRRFKSSRCPICCLTSLAVSPMGRRSRCREALRQFWRPSPMVQKGQHPSPNRRARRRVPHRPGAAQTNGRCKDPVDRRQQAAGLLLVLGGAEAWAQPNSTYLL